MSTLPFDDETVRDALRSVDDPEAGMNIVDLGLIYEIEVVPGKVTVEMTMTTQACPMTDMILEQSRAAIGSVAPPATVASQSGSTETAGAEAAVASSFFSSSERME